MDSRRRKFAGSDQNYLRDQQYADATRLTARGTLHERYSTSAAFGVEVGVIVLREHFSDVAWHAHRDELACSDPDDVIAYLCSVPPGEDATADERERIVELVHQRSADGDGEMRISKDTGCFVCSGPLIVNPG